MDQAARQSLADSHKQHHAIMKRRASKRKSTKVKSDLRSLLAAVRLTAFAPKMIAFGIESVEDLVSGDVEDEDLMNEEIGMTRAHVQQLRATLAKRQRGPQAAAQQQRKVSAAEENGSSPPINEDDLHAFLSKLALGVFEEKMVAFGIESVEDLLSGDVEDDDLMGEGIGMTPAQVQRLHAAALPAAQ